MQQDAYRSPTTKQFSRELAAPTASKKAVPQRYLVHRKEPLKHRILSENLDIRTGQGNTVPNLVVLGFVLRAFADRDFLR